MLLRERIDAVQRGFERQYGGPAQFIARAPGRVNLLGEHTDYNGLPVLPMAIEPCVLIAGRARGDTVVQLTNSDRRFAARRFEIGTDIEPFTAGDWGNYPKAAAQGLARHGLESGSDAAIHHGADLYVAGDLPAGAGLSSSSALVVASALALLAANDAQVPFAQLAELLPRAERYVGTLSGGMDQAASLLAQEGMALRIDFFPLQVRPVPLPPGYSIVVCHSLVRAEKAGPAKRAYNLRVVECRLACRAMEVALGDRLRSGLRHLGDLARQFPEQRLSSFLPQLAQILPERPLSLAAVASALQVDVNTLRRDCEIPSDIGDRFAVVRRARHVLGEGDRVQHAEQALRDGQIEAFARWMEASHASCRDHYEISCPEIEELVRQARVGGALAARLTGAGFGGCTVNLVADESVMAFVQHMDRSFYARRIGPGELASNYRFVFHPQAGAGVVRLRS